jgi:hypothetical protein
MVSKMTPLCWLLVPSSIEKLLAKMRQSPKGTAFADAVKVAEHYFGPPRQRGTSHAVFKMPWAGDPRVNLQNDHGKAKVYQVRQLLDAVDRLGRESKEA